MIQIAQSSCYGFWHRGIILHSRLMTFASQMMLLKLSLCPLSVEVYDQFDYLKEKRDADAVAGDLGTDFMLQNKAIIDFGAKKLYLMK